MPLALHWLVLVISTIYKPKEGSCINRYTPLLA
jgi:hypothetical protein